MVSFFASKGAPASAEVMLQLRFCHELAKEKGVSGFYLGTFWRLVGGLGVLPRKILNFRSPETQFRAIKGSKEQLSC